LLQNGNLAHDLGHSGRIAPKLVLLDEFDGDLEATEVSQIPFAKPTVYAHLDITSLLPTKLDLAKFTFSDGITKDVLAEFGVLFSLGMIVPTPSTTPGLLAMAGGDDRWWCGIVILDSADVMRLGHSESFLLPLDIHLGLRDQDAVENFACLSGRAL